ncbi:MAG: hypothetical protein JO356_18355 [Acidobacteria bacterium]|nr:hypothetical protein [Acidobacteriota bacterium]
MKSYRSFFVIPLLVMFCLYGRLGAQQGNPPDSPENSKLDPAVTPYHAEFVVTELEDGKKVNTRHFSMNINAGRRQSVKIGSRVPVEFHGGELQYLDIGTDITCHLEERQNGLGLEVSAQISSMADHTNPPVVRQFRIESSTVAAVGKPVIIGTADVPDSTHQFALEVTVTKAKP